MSLVLHIGQPKTATTTFQCAIMELPENRRLYLGKHRSGRGEFDQLVNRLIEEGKGGDELLAVAHRLLQQAKGEPLIYSNEMVLVDGVVSWQQKLHRLGKALAEVEPVFLVTCRKPDDLLLSLFAELKVSGNYRDFKTFLVSNQAAIADIASVDTAIALHSSGRYFVEFEALVASGFRTLRPIIPNLHLPEDIGKMNVRAATRDGIFTRYYSAREVLVGHSSVRYLKTKIPAPLRKLFASGLEKIPMGRRGIVNYNLKAEIASDLMQNYEDLLASCRISPGISYRTGS